MNAKAIAWYAGCPVCGKTGLKQVHKRPNQDAIFTCAAGHPHYKPRY